MRKTKYIWTPEQTSLLEKHYKKMKPAELTALLSMPLYTIRQKAVKLNLTREKEKPWTEDELEYLADNYGRKSAAEIAKHLGRTKNALKIAGYRKLKGLNQCSNIFTARGTAETLGVACSKTVVAWHNKGYLVGKRAPFCYGDYQVWWFEYEDLIKCLQDRPWLVDPKRMPESFFRPLVQEEWEKNRWYTKEEAGHFLGLADGNPIYRYIKAGWLPANRRPRGGGMGEWIIRHSDLAEFQLHDPRPAHRKSQTVAGAITSHMEQAEKKAWKALSRHKYQMFGYWAGVWCQLNSINGRQKSSPFDELIQVAKNKGGSAETTER